MLFMIGLLIDLRLLTTLRTYVFGVIHLSNTFSAKSGYVLISCRIGVFGRRNSLYLPTQDLMIEIYFEGELYF